MYWLGSPEPERDLLSPMYEPTSPPSLALSNDGDYEQSLDDQSHDDETRSVSDLHQYDERPPHLLKSINLFLGSNNANVYLGLRPRSNGYGEAIVSVCVVVVHGNEWVELTLDQLPTFFVALRKAGDYANFGIHAFDRPCNDFYINGKCDVIRNGDCFEITFTDGEYETQVLSAFPEGDLTTLLTMEAVIDGRVFLLTRFESPRAAEALNALVLKFRLEPSKIREAVADYMYNNIDVELAMNHYEFFLTVVKEFFNNNESNKSLF